MRANRQQPGEVFGADLGRDERAHRPVQGRDDEHAPRREGRLQRRHECRRVGHMLDDFKRGHHGKAHPLGDDLLDPAGAVA